MRVKYAAGIVKNRVTADRRVTCAIEHVGSIPSFHRSAHLVSPSPPHPALLVFPFFRLFFRSPPSKFPAHVCLAIIVSFSFSSSSSYFFFFFSIIHGVDNEGGRREPRKESGTREESGERRASFPTILARITVDTRSSWAAFASFSGASSSP